jgi:VCBS repeat-containing protein
LTFTLVGAPAGAAITATGDFTWTPIEAQGPGVYTFDVVVTDDGTGLLSDSETIDVTVNEVNVAPVVTNPGDQSDAEGSAITPLPVLTSDADDPANGLTWSAVGLPPGLSIAAGSGVISGTPPFTSAGAYPVTVTVTDDGLPSLFTDVAFTWTITDTNRAPTADPIADTAVDELVLLSFTATGSDPDLDGLTWTVSSGPVGAAITAGGDFTWTPIEAQGPGVYAVTVRVTDDGTPNLWDEESFTITVNEVNVAPVADPIGDVAIDELTLFGVIATASDVDDPANGLTWTLTSGPVGAAITPAGTFTWTPTEAQGPGVYAVTVRVTDDGTPNLWDEESFTITVNEVNVAPVLDPVGDKSVDELVLHSFTATGSDVDTATGSDVDDPANGLTFTLVGAPAGAAITATGDFTWTPIEAQGPGSYGVTLRVTDDGTPNLWDEESFTVTVNEVNVAPVADPIADTTINELALYSFVATATDSDQPANALSWTMVSGPTGASVGPGGVFSWTPSEVQGPGVYPIVIRVTDDGTPFLSTDAAFTLTVNEVNGNPPIANPDGPFSTPEGWFVSILAPGVLANDTDADVPADTLTAALVTPPAFAASFSLNPDGSFLYLHDGSENLADSFVYEVFDGINTSAPPAVVTITMTPINDQTPIAVDDSYIVPAEGDIFTVLAAAGVLSNDTDADMPGDTLSAAVVADVSYGTLTLNPDGSFTYTHDGSENHLDAFTYEVFDGLNTSAVATVAININATNDKPPVAVDDAYGGVAEGGDLIVLAPTGVLANDTDADIPADTLVVIPGAVPLFGVFALNPDGSFSYTHDGSENHADSFTYTVSDGTWVSAPATVSLTVTPVNDPPALLPAAVSINEDLTVGSTVANMVGSDPDGDALMFYFASPDPAFTIDSGTGQVSLAAGVDYELTSSYLLTVVVDDPSGESASALLVVSIVDVDEPPIVTAAVYPAVDDMPVGTSLGVVPAFDPEGLAVTLVIVDGDPGGTFVIDPITKEIALAQLLDAATTPGYTLTVEASDPGGNTATLILVVLVSPGADLPDLNLSPLAIADAVELNEDTSAFVFPLSNDSDPDGDGLIVISITSPQHGTLRHNGDFSYTYFPDRNWFGAETVTYAVGDGRGGTNGATIVFTVAEVNDPPLTPNLSFGLEFTDVITIPILSGIVDPDGDPITITLNQAGNGVVWMSGGDVIYDPIEGFNGTDSFLYTATDGRGGSSSGLVTIRVTQLDGALISVDFVTAEPVPAIGPEGGG